MEPGSPSVSSSERSTNRTADIIGVVIALLTLIAPLAVIAYYSGSLEPLPSTGHTLPQTRSR